MKTLQAQSIHSLRIALAAFAALLYLLLSATALLAEEPANPEQASLEQASIEQAAAVTVDGHYAGTIRIKAPEDLGLIDFAIDLGANATSLAGRLVTSRTEAFSGDITFQGTLNLPGNGITTTFTLISAPFAGEISGSEVVRTLTLRGEFRNEDHTLQGSYSEIIEGFTPEAITVTGEFLLVRAAAAISQVDPPPPPGDSVLYMPALKNQSAASTSAAQKPAAPAQVRLFMPALANQRGTPAQEPTIPAGESSTESPIETPAQTRMHFYLPALANQQPPVANEVIGMESEDTTGGESSSGDESTASKWISGEEELATEEWSANEEWELEERPQLQNEFATAEWLLTDNEIGGDESLASAEE